MSSDTQSIQLAPFRSRGSASNEGANRKSVKSRMEDASDYPHANVVQQFLNGWISALNSGTIVSSLLSAVATAFFVHIRELVKSPLPGPPAATNALLVFAYASILANCTAAIVSFYLANYLLSIPLKIAEKIYNYEDEERSNPRGALFDYVTRRINWSEWGISRAYWIFTAFLGFFSVFIELALYGYIFETNPHIRVALGFLTTMGVIPLVIFALNVIGITDPFVNGHSNGQSSSPLCPECGRLPQPGLPCPHCGYSTHSDPSGPVGNVTSTGTP